MHFRFYHAVIPVTYIAWTANMQLDKMEEEHDNS
jgi:hypothetical protein